MTTVSAYTRHMTAFSGIDADKLKKEGRRQGATFLALFGSHARGDTHPESDVDLLARFENGKSLLDLASIESRLSEAIGKKVDLVTEGALSPLLRQTIMKEMVILLDHEP